MHSLSLKYPELWSLLKSPQQILTDISRLNFILSFLQSLQDSECRFTLKKDPSELSQFPTQHSHCSSSHNQSLSHCKPTPKEAVGKSQSVIVSAVPVIVSLITRQYRQQIDGCPTIHPPAFRPEPSAINRINLVGIITFIITITV